MKRVQAVPALAALASIVVACCLDGAAQGSVLSICLGYALLFLWAAGALNAGRFFAHRVEPERRGSGKALRVFLFAFLFILFSVLLAGLCGRIGAVGLSIPAALGLLLPRSEGAAPASSGTGVMLRFVKEHPLAAVIVLVAGGLTVANAAWAVLLPPFAHDDLSYHLVFPMEWMQKGTIETRAIPFGNHSPPYYPMNAEIFYLWLLLPLRQAFFLNAAQVVFLGVAVVALHSIFRRCGAGQRASITAASLFCLSPLVARELGRAYVDVAFAAFFLMAVDACLAFREKPTTGRWLQFVAIAGLFAGTKILGVALGLLLLAPFFVIVLWLARKAAGPVPAVRVVRNLLLGGVVFLACGGWWYVRNFLLTGNPVFPLDVEIFGVTLFPGAYNRGALPESHLASLVEFFDSSKMGLLESAVFWLFAAGALVTACAAVVKRRFVLFLLGVVLPGYLALLFCCVVPFDYPRFILAAYGLACAVFLVPLDAPRPWRLAAELVIVAVLAVIFLSAELREDLLLPFIEPRLVSTALVWGAYAVGCLGIALLAVACFGGGPCRTAIGCTLRVGIPGALLLCFFCLASRVADPGGACFVEGFRQAREPFILVHENYSGKKVAVTGTNQSFLLYGKNLSNSVAYVNVNRGQGWMFHDHVSHYQGDRELLMGDRNGAGYYRGGATYHDWIVNVETWGADILVCSRLMPWNLGREKGYVYDNKGFPLEAIWAERHPQKFRKVFESPFYRIFERVD